MPLFPLAWTDVCSLQINYKIWREEFCLVLFPCKMSPSCWFFTVYTSIAQELEEKKTVSSWALQRTVALPSAHLHSSHPFTSQYAIRFASPHVCFFPLGSSRKNVLFLMHVSTFLLSVFFILEGKLDHRSLKHLQTDWISCNSLGWCSRKVAPSKVKILLSIFIWAP